VIFSISGPQESEYQDKPFEPEPSSGSFAAANVKKNRCWEKNGPELSGSAK
jgi:hypothetical protein